MRLSPSEEYGLRCILRLAKSHAQGLATVEEIAREEGLSAAYVEKLLLHLKRAGLVASTRGASGGYSLTRNPSAISVGSVFRAMDGTFLAELCDRFSGEHEECVHLRQCHVRPLWVVLAHHVYRILDSVSLTDLLKCEGEAEIRRELYERFPVVTLLDAEGGKQFETTFYA